MEMLVALSIFSLVGLAGFTLLEQALRVRSQLADREARLAEVQRALFLWRLDLMQATQVQTEGNDGTAIIATLGNETQIRYELREQNLVRIAQVSEQSSGSPILDDVANVTFRFLDNNGAWDIIPDPELDRGIEMSLVFNGARGSVRAIVALATAPPNIGRARP